jgi:hypothetical protein
VLAVPVRAPGNGGSARARLVIPPAGGRLAFAFGVNPDRWLGLVAGPFRFLVAARAGEGEWRSLLDETIDPAREVADRRWQPATIDLAPFAGQEIELRFTVEATGTIEGADDLGGFAEPRLLLTPP